MYARKALGKLLRAHREARELRLLDVAEHLGKSVPYVSGVERGGRTICPSLLDRLAHHLGLSDAEYARAFLLRKRLPPHVESHFLRHPDQWPVRRTAG